MKLLQREQSASSRKQANLANGIAGALSGLQFIWGDGRQGANWAGADDPLGAVVYSTYTEADYDTIWDNYMYFNNRTDWFAKVRLFASAEHIADLVATGTVAYWGSR